MFISGMTLLTTAGTLFTAHQAYHQNVSDRQVVILSAAGGFLLSIFLQTLAGKFSTKETSLTTRICRTLVGDFTSILSSVILPFSVAYGYIKKSGDYINKNSYGFIQIDPTITVKGHDVSHLYPSLVGANFGFLAGQMLGKFVGHFKG